MTPVQVEDVHLEVGIGSPIPVDLFVSGTWPDLCSQIASMSQRVENNRIEIELLATVGKAGCPIDQLGLPFRISIPLNVVELPVGPYTAFVNGKSVSFDLPVKAPQAAATSTPDNSLGLIKATTYQDKALGFAFDYPTDWIVTNQQSEGGESRASVISFTEDYPALMTPDKTRFDLSVARWEPLDLGQYVETRKTAWEASSISVQSEEDWTLAGSLQTKWFQVIGPDNTHAFFMFTLIRDRFISISGSGDTLLLERIARTLRPTQ